VSATETIRFPVDPQLFDWKDPDRPSLYYDLREDARELLKGSPFDYKDGFRRIQHYSPHPEPLRVENLTDSVKEYIEPIMTEDGKWETVLTVSSRRSLKSDGAVERTAHQERMETRKVWHEMVDFID